VFMPIPVAGLFTVTPFVGGRLTYYDRRAVGKRFDRGATVESTIAENRVRRQIEMGVEAETRATRVFDMGGAGGIAALQHVIEPRAMLTEIRGIDQKALPQYDPGQRGPTGGLDPGFYGRAGIDNIGRVNEVTYSITNRLNAKTVAGEGQEPVRWELARFAVGQTFDISRASQDRQPFGDLTGEAIVQPTSFLRFRGNAAYNMYGLGLRQATADITATYRDVAVSAGSRYDAIVNANFVTAQLSAKILPYLYGRASADWDIVSGDGVDTRIGFDLRFQCFAIMVEYVNRHHNENEFRFSVNLLGIGQTGTKFGLQ
jgi:LPS transport system D